MKLLGPEFTPDRFGDPRQFVVPDSDRTTGGWVIPYVENVMVRSIKCEPHGPIECFDWWYVPEFSIGARGFIVDKLDRNIRILSSRPDISLAQQFAAYDIGFRHDLMDLIITRVHDFDGAVRFLDRQNLWHNSKDEVGPGECPSNGIPLGPLFPTGDVVRWTYTEIEVALRKLPFRFRSQRLHERAYLLHPDELPLDFELERGS